MFNEFRVFNILKGHEVNIEILVQDNEAKFLAISDDFPPPEPYFYEQGKFRKKKKKQRKINFTSFYLLAINQSKR